ncbi:VanZ family protein [Neptunitalea lumnitzerae]|nr:VanZ family protein [Neptunitalea sp. Y10]
MSDAPKIEIENFDKLVHAGFHFIGTILWYLFIKLELKNKYLRHSLILAMAIDFLYGCIIEVLQKVLTETRHADLFDILSNAVGIVIAAVLVKIIIKKTSK